MMPLANSTFSNARPRAVDASFYSSTYKTKTDIINVKHVTDFQSLFGFSDFLSRCMHYTVWIHCRKRPNCDFCISQNSV